MKYHGIVVTGTSGSGKTKVAKTIAMWDYRFVQVKAVTSRVARPDDALGDYDYVCKDEFLAIKGRGGFLIAAEYREEHYGIREEDFEGVAKRGKIPILSITAESAVRLEEIDGQDDPQIRTQRQRFLSVFLDAADNVLNGRLGERGEAVDRELVLEQRRKDRKYKDRMLYWLENKQVDSCAELIVWLWDHTGVGGVLSARLIRLMIDCGMLLEGARAENVSGASYDLSLGDEFFYGGRIRQLTGRDPIHLIEPYDYAIVTSQEVSNLPRDVCGRFDLSVGLFCQGVILSNGPQVDPGFRGRLFCLLFNTSSSPVLLRRGQHYATLEFHKLLEPTHVYSGRHQGQLDMVHYLPSNATQGAINELKKEIEEVRRESRNLQNMTWAILSLILAMIAIFVSFK